jgi:hypothetical protein
VDEHVAVVRNGDAATLCDDTASGSATARCTFVYDTGETYTITVSSGPVAIGATDTCLVGAPTLAGCASGTLSTGGSDEVRIGAHTLGSPDQAYAFCASLGGPARLRPCRERHRAARRRLVRAQ